MLQSSIGRLLINTAIKLIRRANSRSDQVKGPAGKPGLFRFQQMNWTGWEMIAEDGKSITEKIVDPGIFRKHLAEALGLIERCETTPYAGSSEYSPAPTR